MGSPSVSHRPAAVLARAFVLQLTGVEMTGSGFALARDRLDLTGPTSREACERAKARWLSALPGVVHGLVGLTVETKDDGTVLIQRLTCRPVGAP